MFKGPVHRYRAGGRVHRDTAPIIWCISCVVMDKHASLHTCPHHNHHLMPLGSQVDAASARLRAHWRHEQVTLQMLLATYDHHAAPLGQSRARSGGEARDVPHGRVPEAPPPQGSRPPCLGEPRGPQARIQQRRMEQLADVVPMVQILDTPVPQMVEQLPDVLRFFATLLPVSEQVIEVPKIVFDDVPVRTSVRDTQLVEQLVEVPTIISYSSLQPTTEQHVYIPVPRCGGRHPGLQGFPPKQSSTATPSSKKRISERIVEQIVDPVSSRPLLGSLPRQGSFSSHSPTGVEELADEPGVGVFRTFPQNKKKCEVGFALESESSR